VIEVECGSSLRVHDPGDPRRLRCYPAGRRPLLGNAASNVSHARLEVRPTLRTSLDH